MLSTNKLRTIYSKIQKQLFYMIPEKWEKICLYASIMEQVNNLQTGEMFFYYYPTGLLKKNPINVYEIPNKFNIDEKEYMKLVDKLYNIISELREEFKESKEEKMWTNLTITIQNLKFNVEYSYEDLLGSKYTSYDRHIIWKCKYLDFPLERLSKKDKNMVEEYYIEQELSNQKTKNYVEGIYKKGLHNIAQYNNEYIKEDEQEEESKKSKPKKEKVDKYEEYKRNQEEKKQKELEMNNIEVKLQEKKKNQILNY